ncbi:MAG TPA: D-glycero-beta-D-manno-heptose 1-phosphate adenylyltransferase, partial [Flavobacteriales bacterium]|nr:D-glycero-beta-D-manno-heptose 1-phosphate adenylyltransferase [Flavobacteriales bacterium]
NEIAGSSFVLKNGGEVKTIPLVQGFSTTSIEERIKNS